MNTVFYNAVCEAAECDAIDKAVHMCGSGHIGQIVLREDEWMKSTKSDRRSERSRRLLGDALVSLLAQGRYVDLTVQDILDRAGVGRSTFYAHYWDKDDLLASELERVIGVLGQRMEGEEGGKEEGEESGERTVMGIPSRALF